MSSPLLDIRDEVYNRILLKKNLAQFSFNNFTLQKTWVPYQDLKTFATDHPEGKLYIIGMGADDIRSESRNHMTRREIPVGVLYQKALADPDDDTEISSLVEFFDDEILYTLRKEIDLTNFEYLRGEYVKGENEETVPFVMQREAATFESFFMPYYLHILE